jgi:hypothetical protein
MVRHQARPRQWAAPRKKHHRLKCLAPHPAPAVRNSLPLLPLGLLAPTRIRPPDFDPPARSARRHPFPNAAADVGRPPLLLPVMPSVFAPSDAPAHPAEDGGGGGGLQEVGLLRKCFDN